MVNLKKVSGKTDLQRVFLRLARAEGSWVSRRQLEQVAGSPASRVRDLRTSQYGGFNIECASASELGKRNDPEVFYYRLSPSELRVASKISAVL